MEVTVTETSGLPNRPFGAGLLPTRVAQVHLRHASATLKWATTLLRPSAALLWTRELGVLHALVSICDAELQVGVTALLLLDELSLKRFRFSDDLLLIGFACSLLRGSGCHY